MAPEDLAQRKWLRQMAMDGESAEPRRLLELLDEERGEVIRSNPYLKRQPVSVSSKLRFEI